MNSEGAVSGAAYDCELALLPSSDVRNNELKLLPINPQRGSYSFVPLAWLPVCQSQGPKPTSP